MSYIEFRCNNEGGESDVNGGGPQFGASDGPIYTTSADSTDAGGGNYVLTDAAEGEWAGVQVGDYLCYDAAGAKTRARVEELAFLANPNTLLVSVDCGEENNKVCNVGGAFENPDVAFAAIETLRSHFADGTPPRLNIKGDQTLTGIITATQTWTNKCPFVIQGYGTAPGDNPATKPILDMATQLVDLATYDYTVWVDLHFKKTGNNADIVFDASLEVTGLLRCTIEATAGTGYVLSGLGGAAAALDCVVKNTGATGYVLYSPAGTFVGCTIQGGRVAITSGKFIHCLFPDSWVTTIRSGTQFVNCTVEVRNDHPGLSIDVSDAGAPLVVWNTIISGVSATKHAVVGDETNYCYLFSNYNDYWSNAEDIDPATIPNYHDGEGDIDADPDLDGNDRPQAGSAVLGAGHPAYLDIGWGQKEEGGGGGMLQANKRGNKQ